MDPMYLGLIDGPFVPHNLTSTQQSPVPLPQFKMASRLKSQWPPGPKRNPHIIFFRSSQKSQQTNPLQIPQRGPHEERGLPTGHFAYLSKTSFLGSPVKEPSPRFLELLKKYRVR
jgi:hypothetical protein